MLLLNRVNGSIRGIIMLKLELGAEPLFRGFDENKEVLTDQLLLFLPLVSFGLALFSSRSFSCVFRPPSYSNLSLKRLLDLWVVILESLL